MRTSGVLRVILNAHIVAGMKFELANDNCLRFTNVDGIYLVKVLFAPFQLLLFVIVILFYFV